MAVLIVRCVRDAVPYGMLCLGPGASLRRSDCHPSLRSVVFFMVATRQVGGALHRQSNPTERGVSLVRSLRAPEARGNPEGLMHLHWIASGANYSLVKFPLPSQ